jgi:hypothetical protein
VVRRAAGLLAAVALVGAMAGCDDGGTGPDEDPGPAWRASSAPVDPTGLVWAAGSTVHLADGTAIDTGRPLGPYVVAGDGVYFTSDTGKDGRPIDGGQRPSRLYLAEPDGTVSDTGADAFTLGASPDGRYLGFLDLTTGDQDRFGTPQAQAVVVDLQTGEEVVRSSAGMGDPEDDDLAALYPEIMLGIARVTDDTAYVDAVGDTYAYDLATGESELLPQGTEPPGSARDDPQSPDGAWRIVAGKAGRDLLVSADGARVTPRAGTPRWDLEWWADERTVVGYAVSGPGGPDIDEDDSLALMACVVPTGDCEVFAETTGATVRFPVGSPTEHLRLVLQDGA